MQASRRLHSSSVDSAGMALIEVMVVLLIMSIALLGMAGLQANTIRQTGSASNQTVAMMLADDLIGRMNSNRPGLVVNNVVVDTNYRKAPGNDFPTAGVTNCTNGTGCSTAQLATTDLVQWSQMLQNSLPTSAAILNANTFVCLDSNPSDSTECDGLGSTFLIQIGWFDTLEGGATNNIQTYRISFQP